MASTSPAADDVSEADDDYFRKWNQARRVVLSGRASRAGLAALTTLEKILRAVVDKKRRRIKCKSNTFQKLDILDGATDFLLLAGFRRPVMGEGDILELSESFVPQSLAAADLLRTCVEPSAAENVHPSVDESLFGVVIGLGFDELLVRKALEAGCDSVEVCVEWVLEHSDDRHGVDAPPTLPAASTVLESVCDRLVPPPPVCEWLFFFRGGTYSDT